MRTRIRLSWFVHFSLFLPAYGVLFNSLACAQALSHGSSPARIAGPVDESSLVTLSGNTHPLAQAQFDQGPAPASMPAGRLLLVLARSTQQEADLQTYLQSLQDANSPNYRKFLTPGEFGQRFGVGDSDLQSIQAWLASQGFTVGKVSKGRMVIEFSGTAGQVQTAFHTSLHRYAIGGVQNWANAADPQIPSALAPVVAGFASLNSFYPAAHYIRGPDGVYNPQTNKITPTYTIGNTSSGYYIFVGPADAATIYDTPTTLNANQSGTAYDGTGVTIGIAGDSNIDITQNANYRSTFGLPTKAVTVVVDGNDPGENGDAVEAYLDTQVSGGIAPNANVILYTAANTSFTAGVYLAVIRAIDDNQADILNLSFGECESSLGAAGNQFINAVWEQAAAQGISVTVSSGDSGSAGCDNPNAETVATQGLAVNGLASTPYNISLGGTDYDILYSNFPTSFTNYVDITNTLPNHRSALKYIPEEPWNDSTYPNTDIAANKPISVLEGSASDDNIIAGGGGVSSVYPLPTWQANLFSGAKRGLPDVSLLSGNGAYGAVWGICTDQESGNVNCAAGATGNSFNLTGVGGTSAAAPAFAGMLALVEQKTGSRLGQADYVLYNLAGSKYSTVFHDVTAGDNSVNCQAASSGCVLNNSSYYFLAGYNATTGYDQASGLGSVDASQLLTNWANAGLVATNSALQLNGATSALSITHGQSVSVSASVAGAGGSPSGNIALVDSLSPAIQPNSEGITEFTLTGGSASGTTNSLPGGTYQASAHYGGSSIFAASDSNSIPVTVGAESSTTIITGVTAYNATTGILTSAPTYGDIYRIDAMPYGNSASAANPNGAATGKITFTDGSITLGTAPLGSSGSAELTTYLISGGNNNLVASYPGDASFKASTSAPFPYEVAAAPTNLGLSSGPTTVNAGEFLSLSADLGFENMNSSVAPPTGTMTFNNGSTALGSSPVAGACFGDPCLILFTSGLLQVGTYSVSAAYSGDGNYAASGSQAIQFTVLPFLPTVTIVPAQNTVPVNQALTLAVTISASNNLPSATGTVSLSAPGYTGSAVSLVNGAATISIPANTLPVGVDTLTASYSGNALYFAAATGTGSVQVVSAGSMKPTVAVTPAQTSVTSYPVSIEVTITGTAGNPTPTGPVNLSTPVFVAPSQTLVNGVATFSLSAADFDYFANTLTATYFGDTVYASNIGTGVVNIPMPVSPTVIVTPQTDTFYVNQSVSVAIALNGPAGDPVPTGTVYLSGAGYTSPTTNLASGSATIVIPANSLYTGQNPIQLFYSGNGFYTGAIVLLNYIVMPITPSLAVSGTAVSLVPGATTGNTSTITLTPSGGFTGSVALAAAITSSPAGAEYLPTLSFGSTSPVTITGASAASATLTISTTAATSAVLVRPKRPGTPWYLADGASLACILLFCVPVRRRKWQKTLSLFVFLLLLTGGALSCGGGGSSGGGGGGGGGISGTTAGNYVITVTGTSGTITATATVNLTVQ
jgi:hypothetical protein